MTPYGERGFVLAHDARSEREMSLWRAWSDAHGWDRETFEQFRQRVEKEEAEK